MGCRVSKGEVQNCCILFTDVAASCQNLGIILEKNKYSCMSLYMRWPLRNFYNFNHLVDSYRNTISEWVVGFRYGNFNLKLACGLIFGGEEISIPENRPIRKSYIPKITVIKKGCPKPIFSSENKWNDF